MLEKYGIGYASYLYISYIWLVEIFSLLLSFDLSQNQMGWNECGLTVSCVVKQEI